MSIGALIACSVLATTFTCYVVLHLSVRLKVPLPEDTRGIHTAARLIAVWPLALVYSFCTALLARYRKHTE